MPKNSATIPADDEAAVNQVLEGVARYFGLLSEPMRLRIIHAICESEQSVSNIVKASGANQANVSRHLSLLYNAGVLSRRRDGNFIYYRVNDPTLIEICRSACNRIAMTFDTDNNGQKSAIQLASGFQSAEKPKRGLSTKSHHQL